MKYIDADRLRAEIEFSKSVYSNPKRVVHGVADAFRQDGRAAMCDDILKKLDSLQQDHIADVSKMVESEHIADVSKMIEQQEVGLQKEIDKEWEKCNPIDEGMGVEMAYIHIEQFDMIVRYFYELGKKQ